MVIQLLYLTLLLLLLLLSFMFDLHLPSLAVFVTDPNIVFIEY